MHDEKKTELALKQSEELVWAWKTSFPHLKKLRLGCRSSIYQFSKFNSINIPYIKSAGRLLFKEIPLFLFRKSRVETQTNK
jgi:hypothetical protein